MRRLDCHDRIKQVKGSYRTALQTVNVLVELAEQQPQLVSQHDLNVAALRALARELHDIYFARMFASFESSLRHYWRTKVKDTKPWTEQLLSAIAGRRGVPQDTLDTVQKIRDFRNFLIHGEREVETRFTLDEASGHLNTFLARLPVEW